MKDLLDKLDEAEALTLEAYQDLEKKVKHQTEETRRTLRSVVTAICRARQIMNEAQGTPEVARFEFSQGTAKRFATSAGEAKDERHESYGVISITKPQGLMRLAGSMVDNLPGCIEVRIHRGVRVIDTHLSTEHWYPDNKAPLLSFRLSHYQWAEAISSLNGVGVACTIKDVQGVPMHDPPEQAKTPLEQIADDAKAKANEAINSSGEDFLAALTELAKQVDDLKLSKKKTDDFKAAIKNIGNRFHSRPKETAAWVAKRLAEDSEKVVSQAKVEIAAALTSIVQAAGLKALNEKMGLKAADLTPQLSEKSQ